MCGNWRKPINFLRYVKYLEVSHQLKKLEIDFKDSKRIITRFLWTSTKIMCDSCRELDPKYLQLVEWIPLVVDLPCRQNYWNCVPKLNSFMYDIGYLIMRWNIMASFMQETLNTSISHCKYISLFANIFSSNKWICRWNT